MAVDKSKIEWTDATWSPIRGCSMVSAGCTNCYAMKQAHRFSGKGKAYEGLTKLSANGPVWTGKVRLVPELLDQPLRWKKPRRIFVNSMSDLFHESVPFEFIDRVFAVMALSDQHVFQVLTKRPERMLEYMQRVADELTVDEFGNGPLAFACRQTSINAGHKLPQNAPLKLLDWPLPNCWLGVSVENQETANQRVPVLLGIPAALHWVSCEPMLDDVDFTWLQVNEGINGGELKSINYVQTVDALNGTYITDMGMAYDTPNKLKWIIVGGESGVGARAFCMSWVRNIIHDCTDAKVPVFVKQLGAKPYETTDDEHAEDTWPVDHYLNLKDRKGGDMDEWPDDLKIREYPAT